GFRRQFHGASPYAPITSMILLAAAAPPRASTAVLRCSMAVATSPLLAAKYRLISGPRLAFLPPLLMPPPFLALALLALLRVVLTACGVNSTPCCLLKASAIALGIASLFSALYA